MDNVQLLQNKAVNKKIRELLGLQKGEKRKQGLMYNYSWVYLLMK